MTSTLSSPLYTSFSDYMDSDSKQNLESWLSSDSEGSNDDELDYTKQYDFNTPDHSPLPSVISLFTNPLFDVGVNSAPSTSSSSSSQTSANTEQIRSSITFVSSLSATASWIASLPFNGLSSPSPRAPIAEQLITSETRSLVESDSESGFPSYFSSSSDSGSRVESSSTVATSRSPSSGSGSCPSSPSSSRTGRTPRYPRRYCHEVTKSRFPSPLPPRKRKAGEYILRAAHHRILWQTRQLSVPYPAVKEEALLNWIESKLPLPLRMRRKSVERAQNELQKKLDRWAEGTTDPSWRTIALWKRRIEADGLVFSPMGSLCELDGVRASGRVESGARRCSAMKGLRRAAGGSSLWW